MESQGGAIIICLIIGVFLYWTYRKDKKEWEEFQKKQDKERADRLNARRKTLIGYPYRGSYNTLRPKETDKGKAPHKTEEIVEEEF